MWDSTIWKLTNIVTVRWGQQFYDGAFPVHTFEPVSPREVNNIVLVLVLHHNWENIDHKLGAGVLPRGNWRRYDNKEENSKIVLESTLIDATSRIDKTFDNNDNGCFALQKAHHGCDGSCLCYRSKWKALRLTVRSNVLNADYKAFNDDSRSYPVLTWPKCSFLGQQLLTLHDLWSEGAVPSSTELSCLFVCLLCERMWEIWLQQ